jgi:uncharacterized protein YbaP (TraB family)
MSANVFACDEENTAILDNSNLDIDFSPELTILESEIVEGLQKSRDIGIEAVTKAYNLYGGDFSKFNESNCLQVIEKQMKEEVMKEYERKSQEWGMSAKDLNSSTAGVLAIKFAGREAELVNIKKLKEALRRQIDRKKNAYAGVFQKYWVSMK